MTISTKIVENFGPLAEAGSANAFFSGAVAHSNRGFMADVTAGFSCVPKSIPSCWLYDSEGSRLFSMITQLPEYDLTRNEIEILQTHADEIAASLRGSLWRVVELGAGDGTKAEIILRALARVGIASEYWPIDVSPSALAQLCYRISRSVPHIVCRPIVGDNMRGLAGAVSERSGEKVLLLDLGSSIGNRSRGALNKSMADVHQALRPNDMALIGFDLMKDSRRLLAAYNDSAGITREFNFNLLRRMNRELGANFDLGAFRHEATWNPELEGMESWLVSQADQRVDFTGMGESFALRKWEAIRTEISLKFHRESIARIAKQNHFERCSWYTDRTESFVDVLWRARPHLQ